jgi:3-deoxy-D-manno-octulosonic-acid transferase
MILLLYNLGLMLALAVSAPWWLWQMATTRKYREGLGERLGLIPQRIRRRILDAGATQRVIWLHAVSVGEVLAISRLVAELGVALPNHLVLISTTTRTGQALARERFGADRVFYCPLDLPWAVRSWLRALNPALMVLAETEFWPNLLTCCFRRNTPVAVVNARISDRSWPRYRRLRGLWSPWLSMLTAALAQTELDAERLKQLGCANATVCGNLKFDIRSTQEAEATRLLRKNPAAGLRLVVAGSTLEGEEALLLAAWLELLAANPNLAMILAPRHPERFAAVATLLERSGIKWRRRSEWTTGSLGPGEILLLDSIGELASVYSLASVAFVGGSLVPAGGHNPLEPAQFGIPIVMGEHFFNFRAIGDVLLEHEALKIATPQNLAATIASLLSDEPGAKQMGLRAREVFEGQAGATNRSVRALQQILAAIGAA